jgi:hypothetical membrane protein
VKAAWAPPRNEVLTRSLLWVGAMAPPVVVAFALLGAAVTPGYSHVSDTVSQLAAREAPHPGVMQLGLLLWGLLLEGFAWGLYRSRRGRGAKAVMMLLLISGASVQLAALVRDDPNIHGAASTVEGAVHGLLASIAFLSIVAAIVMFSRHMCADSGSNTVRRFSFRIATAIAIIGLVFELQVLQQVEGLLQRLIYALVVLWMEVILFGWAGLARRRQSSGPTPTQPIT